MPLIARSRPSWVTHAYYRKALLPIIAEEVIGCERTCEAHDQLKAGFYGLDPRGPLPSMREMPQEEAGRFLDWVIRECAERGIVLPDPERNR